MLLAVRVTSAPLDSLVLALTDAQPATVICSEPPVQFVMPPRDNATARRRLQVAEKIVQLGTAPIQHVHIALVITMGNIKCEPKNV